MKRLLKSSARILGLIILVGLIYCFFCRSWRPPTGVPPCGRDSLRYIEYVVKVPKIDPDAIAGEERDSFKVVRVAYRCDEIITRKVDPLTRLILLCKGFKEKKRCQCNDNLVLWKTPPGVDPIGVIDDPPPSGKDSSMTLNFVFPDPDTFVLDPDNLNQLYNVPPEDAQATIKVAVVDTGIDLEVPEFGVNLADFLWENPGPGDNCSPSPFPPNGLDLTDGSDPQDLQGHGTHCSGIVAGYAGLVDESGAVRIEIITPKISEDQYNQMDLFTATCGIHYALNQGAQVINLSWGYLEQHDSTLAGTKNHIPYIMLDALKQASDQKAVIVAALGNESVALNAGQRFWPACFSQDWKYVISVGALSENPETFAIASFSNTYKNSIYAPGTKIVSTVPKEIRRFVSLTPPTMIPLTSEGFASANGTSMAAPMVARAVAIMLGTRPPGPDEYIKDHLLLNFDERRDLQTTISRW